MVQTEDEKFEKQVEEIKREKERERELRKNYNTDKTFVIFTGVLLGLIFLAGTVLGSIDALMRLGFIAVLCVACYIIADIVGLLAVIVDYKEDGNALEISAWIVEGIVALTLLTLGGLVTYRLMSESTQGSQIQTREQAYQNAYKDCVKNLAKVGPQGSVSCGKVAQAKADSIKDTFETSNKTDKETSGWADKILNWPMIHYVPGFVGVFCYLLLSGVKKLTESSKRKEYEKEARERAKLSQPSLHLSSVRLAQPSQVNFDTKVSQPSQDAQQFEEQYGEKHYNDANTDYVRTVYQSSGAQVRDKNNQYIGHLSYSKLRKYREDGNVFLSYQWIMDNMTRKK